MNIKHILNSEVDAIAADLNVAAEGIYLEEEFEGRKALLKKNSIGYLVKLTNPNFSAFSTTAKEAITGMRNELLTPRRTRG
ncbi:MAG TPA: hypothetical protein VJ810_10665 [Blastocatellia bacterium]|nr:hypothetical protein [Blastocatellia bacterium]